VSVSIDQRQGPGDASRDGNAPRGTAPRGEANPAGAAPPSPPKAAPPEMPSSLEPPARRRSAGSIFKILIPAIIVLDVLAFFFIPPYPKDEPGKPITGIPDLITANLELPAPAVVWDFDPEHQPAAAAILFFHPSISSTLFTSWLVIAVVLAVLILATRGLKLVPTRVQNAVEFLFEALENFAISLGGEAARPYVPVFAGFFLFILFSNWSGLLPIFGRVEALRAPTSDVNVTIGLALCSFFYFEYQGFKRLGVRGYLGKFFVFSGFKEGFGNGLVALFVGLIEFFLEFIKPVTLSMRLFGNIFGGEVALGVLTALTIAIIPVGMLGLELLLNFVQALIFSTLTLMFTLIAIESHEEEAHAAPELRDLPEGNLGPPLTTGTAGATH
jgi:F-type H+-transporting ATPase subunit a